VGSLIVTEDNSKDLKVAVSVERSLQGSRRRNTVAERRIDSGRLFQASRLLTEKASAGQRTID